MAETRSDAQSEFIEAVAQAAADRNLELPEHFLRQCMDFAPLDALTSVDQQTLLDVISILAEAGQRVDGPECSVAEPADGEAEARLVCVSPDMSFLVDSLTMAIRASGGSIRWTLHPVMQVRRKDGQRIEVLPRDAGVRDGTAEDGSVVRHESLILIRFSGLENPDAYDALRKRCQKVLADLTAVIDDYLPMRRRLQSIAAELACPGPGCDTAQFTEANAFLQWLDDGHFTFLGFRETRLDNPADTTQPESERLTHLEGTGLGLLRETDAGDTKPSYVAPPGEMQKYVRSSRVLVITKSAARSHLHHPEYMDSISIKHFDERGEIVGTYRFLGLFSSEVYTSAARSIPIVRSKINQVLERTRLPDRSHAAKTLRDIMDSLPRDELLQSSEDELFDTVIGIRALHDHTRLRLFMRRDRYGRFYSCMVYLPRDRYSYALRERMGETLVRIFSATGIEQQVQFLRDGYARVHFMVRTEAGTEIEQSAQDIEQALLDATRSWPDVLRDALREQAGSDITNSQIEGRAQRYAKAFEAAYLDDTPPDVAVADIDQIEALLSKEDSNIRPHLRPADNGCALKLFVRDRPVHLSEILPTLENLGLSISNHSPHRVTVGSQVVWIQDFDCAPSQALAAETITDNAVLFAEAFLAVGRGDAANDALNTLVLSAGVPWRQVALIRALVKYLLQTGVPYSVGYMAEIVADSPEVVQTLLALFDRRFNPDHDSHADEALDARLAEQLDALSSLDADRVLRGISAVIRATQRTNFYQRGRDIQGTDAADSESARPCIAFKIRSTDVPDLPRPLPFIETFVYGPAVEGIHLRGGMVSRGGLRWSDRPEDFRTEVLGLMKAQMVKNAVIVPVGAKGGFVVKNGPPPADREAFLAAGVAAYKQFIGSLLDLTDNRVEDRIVPPSNVVRHDDDDPYLVVAADKGTATFSDTANAIALERGFWLGDAFASGGAAGYDHKKMGITARSAWESVKRHFAEMGMDCQREPFTVLGIGDMSGDVFGNGMLLSEQIKLQVAFNHRHIFIDPKPDPATSFAERKRLFALGRSGWDDYDTSTLSDGGGIYERSAKQIELSEAACAALDIPAGPHRPDALIRLLLQGEYDLLWNGGIGTYVRASTEADAEVGDRGNDSLRITAEQLRVRVVGEGGNLGLTQRARIEYAQHGGRINTDAVDNVGGVSSSDREVNIKIPLNLLLASGELEEAARNTALAAATEAVAELVLEDAREQGRAISMIELRAVDRLDEHANLMRILERRGLLDRTIEFLPSEDLIAERRGKQQGLTRPEIAVLLAYSKIALFQDLVDSPLPDDPALEDTLLGYFPDSLRDAYKHAFKTHRLRRELIATLVTNTIVNTMGMAFVHRMAEEQGCDTHSVARAFLIGERVFGITDMLDGIEAEAPSMDTDLAYRLMLRVTGLAKHGCNWFLAAARGGAEIGALVSSFKPAVDSLRGRLPDALPAAYRKDWKAAEQQWIEQGVPADLARSVANTRVLGTALDIVWQQQHSDDSLELIADCFFHVGEALHVLWLHGAINKLEVSGRWPALARVTLREDTYRLHSTITGHVAACPGDTAKARFSSWKQQHRDAIAFSTARIEEIRSAGSPDYMALTVAVRELRKLRLLE